MWPNPNLVTFTEEILNGKLHFLCSENHCVVSFKKVMFYSIRVMFYCWPWINEFRTNASINFNAFRYFTAFLHPLKKSENLTLSGGVEMPQITGNHQNNWDHWCKMCYWLNQLIKSPCFFPIPKVLS